MTTSKILEVEGLTKRFGGIIAVNNLNFDVTQGEILGLIGPNGAGKTTVFNLISGFLRPDSGTVKFRGEDITGQSPYKIAQKGIARTFQLVKPFNKLTVKENVLIGFLGRFGEASIKTFRVFKNPTSEQEKRVEELLKFVGLLSRKDDPAGSLPFALKKKVEIARALALNPSLLLLDEPTSGLNPSEVKEQIEVIEKIRKRGVTIIIVEHIMRVVMSLSDRIIVLHYGQKIAEGKPEEISSNEKVIEAYLGRRMVDA
jgi:branched-chain amino acid transport system ATP-binding protein